MHKVAPGSFGEGGYQVEKLSYIVVLLVISMPTCVYSCAAGKSTDMLQVSTLVSKQRLSTLPTRICPHVCKLWGFDPLPGGGAGGLWQKRPRRDQSSGLQRSGLATFDILCIEVFSSNRAGKSHPQNPKIGSEDPK